MLNISNLELSEKYRSRGLMGFYFLEDLFSDTEDDEYCDFAYVRIFIILISYNFELILKSIVVLENINNSEIKEQIKHHKLDDLFKKISKKDIYDIEEIIKKDNPYINYEILFKNKEKIVIEDFIDIRYTFEENILRKNLTNKEVKKAIELIINLGNKLKTIIESYSLK